MAEFINLDNDLMAVLSNSMKHNNKDDIAQAVMLQYNVLHDNKIKGRDEKKEQAKANPQAKPGGDSDRKRKALERMKAHANKK